MIFLLVRESHNNTVKQLRPYIPKPQSFQWKDLTFTMAMTEFCTKFSNFEYITLWSIHFIFQLFGWIESKEMQLYYRNFPPFNCQCSYAWRTLSQKKTEYIWKQNWPPLFGFTNEKIQDSGHFSLLKKRPINKH